MAEQSLDKHGAIAILIGIVGIVVTYVLWSISRNQSAPASTTGNSAGTVTVPSPNSSIAPFSYNGPSLPSSNINYTGPVNYTAPGGGIGYLTSAAPKSGSSAKIPAKSGCGCGGDCGNNGPACGSCDGSSLYTSPATQASASVPAIQQAQAYTSSYQASPNYSLLQITPSSNQPVIAYAGA